MTQTGSSIGAIRRYALFLDIDGTLLDFADRPEQVYVSPALKSLLQSLQRVLGGALALVSGRSAEDIDRLFMPGRFALVGSHGAEIRSNVAGELHRHCARPLPQGFIDEVVRQLQRFPQAFIEYKPCGLAVHHPGGSDVLDTLCDMLEAIARARAPALVLLRGRQVVELRPSGITKGTGVAELHAHAPFAERTPVFLGDDVTDLDAFAYVHRVGGKAVSVGERIEASADLRLATPSSAVQWLTALNEKLLVGGDDSSLHNLG